MSLSTLPFDSVAFPIAVNWAKKRFKGRLHHTAVGEAEALLLCGSEHSYDSATATPPRDLWWRIPPRDCTWGTDRSLCLHFQCIMWLPLPPRLSPTSLPLQLIRPPPPQSSPTQPSFSPSSPSPVGQSQKRTIRKRTSPTSLITSSIEVSVQPQPSHSSNSSDATVSNGGPLTSAASDLNLTINICNVRLHSDVKKL